MTGYVHAGGYIDDYDGTMMDIFMTEDSSNEKLFILMYDPYYFETSNYPYYQGGIVILAGNIADEPPLPDNYDHYFEIIQGYN